MDWLNTLWSMFWVWSASPPEHDNAPSYSSLIVTEFLAKHETKVITQLAYSPDLAPWDFFLFPKFKYPFRGTRHESIDPIKRNSLKKLKAIPAKTNSINTPQIRRSTCVTLQDFGISVVPEWIQQRVSDLTFTPEGILRHFSLSPFFFNVVLR